MHRGGHIRRIDQRIAVRIDAAARLGGTLGHPDHAVAVAVEYFDDEELNVGGGYRAVAVGVSGDNRGRPAGGRR